MIKPKWLRRPNSGGWWWWREGGRDEAVMILLTADGSRVVDDDEWERATGRKALADGWSWNYWEGTDTTQKMMPGLWQKCPDGLRWSWREENSK